jgi:pimeloyl-ACP methyl ester carboxylesterase
LVFDTFYATSLIPQLPKMISQAAAGNFGLTSKYMGLLEFDDSLTNLGTYLSVECGEDAPFTSAHQIAAATQALPTALRGDFGTAFQTNYRLCRNWPTPAVSAGAKQPISSAIPTLVLAGEYDPITPPANGRLVAQTLSNSQYFVLPGTGHGVYLTNNCPVRLTQAFLDNPVKSVDANCIRGMQEPFGRN